MSAPGQALYAVAYVAVNTYKALICQGCCEISLNVHPLSSPEAFAATISLIERVIPEGYGFGRPAVQQVTPLAQAALAPRPADQGLA